MKKKVYVTLIVVGFVGACYGIYDFISGTYLAYVEVSDDTLIELEKMSATDERVKYILENKDRYPREILNLLSKNSDMTQYVFDFFDKDFKVESDNIGEVEKGVVPLLLQYDERWGYGVYGDNVLAVNGCGPTAVAMVVAGLTGRNDVTPYEVAQFSYREGYYSKRSGTSWRLLTEGVKSYGIEGTSIVLDKKVMMMELEKGHPIILSMRKGDFTSTGHFIVVTGVKDDKFIVNDSNSRDRSNRLWDYETLSYQIKNLWAFKLMD